MRCRPTNDRSLDFPVLQDESRLLLISGLYEQTKKYIFQPNIWKILRIIGYNITVSLQNVGYCQASLRIW